MFIPFSIPVLLFFVALGAEVDLSQNTVAQKPSKEKLEFQLGTITGRNQIKFKPESFYLKYANLLNNDNSSDKIILSRSTIDFNINLLYGREWYGYDIGEFFVSFRNKATWGNPESIAQTTPTNLKLLEATFGEHRHFIARHIIWIREIWFKFLINETLRLPFENHHYFTMGAFPFELGRGISLGSAFAVGPRFLGFYSDNVIDQFAFAFKLSGDLYKDYLNYDLYGAILENRSDTFTNTAAKIRGQQFNHRLNQERGSGSVNFLLASRLRWYPIYEPHQKTSFEPYMLYNYAPEQRIEIAADAVSKLATFGLAGEFTMSDFEWGFDTALNIGHQSVHGIDRNVVEFENRTGVVNVVNSQVSVGSPQGDKVLYVPNSTAQQLINTSAQSASQNGKSIGMANGMELFNNINRFRNPSVNSYKGWMFIADWAYNFGAKRQCKVAAIAGAASGDRNPNQDIDNPNESDVDMDFKGFIPLQEIYSGSRVQSAFLLGGAGKIPRPLFIPRSRTVPSRLPANISGFTNIIFVGSSFHWYPTYNDRAFMVRPNIIAFWQQAATNAFDIETGMSSMALAKNYLGFEMNSFADAELFDNCKLYFVGSVFIPGSHFADIKGTPLNKDELRLIDRRDRTGITNDKNPLLGDDVAYTLNVGIECRF